MYLLENASLPYLGFGISARQAEPRSAIDFGNFLSFSGMFDHSIQPGFRS